jgi:DUF4097 and DUF4098 domain-containing protein YvlB
LKNRIKRNVTRFQKLRITRNNPEIYAESDMKWFRLLYLSRLFLLLLFILPTCALQAASIGAVADNSTSDRSKDATTQPEPYKVETFRVSGVPNITARTSQGNITITGTDQAQVRVEVYISRRGLPILQSDRIDDQLRFNIRQRNNDIIVEIMPGRSAPSRGGPTVDIIVYTPSKSNAAISSGTGDVMVTDIDGNVEARVGNGSLTNRNGSGSTRLSSAAGDVTVNEFSGTVFANLISGNIYLNSVAGETRLRVTAGDALLDGLSGDVLAQIMSGNITFRANSVHRVVDLEATVGDIRAIIATAAGLHLNLEGSNVTLGQINDFAGDIRHNRVTGALRGGGANIRLKSVTGQVHLEIEQ